MNENDQWNKTCEQLRLAFDNWADLSRGPKVLSADEKQMLEVKSLLRELKGKMDELSEEIDRKPAPNK